MESAQSPPDWTFVTMFFSLEPYFKQRGVASHISHMAKTVYMERFKALVDLNVQLVVYTDSEGRDAMVPLLKDASKVRFIIQLSAQFADRVVYIVVVWPIESEIDPAEHRRVEIVLLYSFRNGLEFG